MTPIKGKTRGPSDGEIALQKYLVDNGIEALWQYKRDPIPIVYKTPKGMRKAYPDFYVRNVNLCIEVKGELTIHEVAEINALAKFGSVNYYLYQYTDPAWNLSCTQTVWDDVAWKAGCHAREEYQSQHRTRPHAMQPRRESELAFNTAYQQQELLALVSSTDAAKKANSLTLERLRFYMNSFEWALWLLRGTDPF